MLNSYNTICLRKFILTIIIGLPNNCRWSRTINLCRYRRGSIQWDKFCWLHEEVYCWSADRRCFFLLQIFNAFSYDTLLMFLFISSTVHSLYIENLASVFQGYKTAIIRLKFLKIDGASESVSHNVCTCLCLAHTKNVYNVWIIRLLLQRSFRSEMYYCSVVGLEIGSHLGSSLLLGYTRV